MGVVTTAISAAIIAAIGMILAWLGKGRSEDLTQRIDRLEGRIDRRFDVMQASIDGLRSDLTQVALAVGVRPRATNA